MAQRFSKQTLAEYLQRRITAIQTEWGFDPSNGTAQIDAIAADRMVTNPLNLLGRSDIHLHRSQAWLAYGELAMLRQIADEYQLATDLVPEGLVVARVKSQPHLIRYRPRKALKSG